MRGDSGQTEPLELKQKALTFVPPSGMGALYVFRIGGPEGAGYRVLLDGVNTGLLRKSQYFYDALPPGPHILGGIRFTVEPGRNCFFLMKPVFGAQTIESVTEAEGQEYARTLKLSGESQSFHPRETLPEAELAELAQIRSIMEKYQIGTTTEKQFQGDYKAVFGHELAPHERSMTADRATSGRINYISDHYKVGTICDLVFESDDTTRYFVMSGLVGYIKLKSITFYK